MRHYLWWRHDGSIGGPITMTGPGTAGGFPAHQDLCDDGSEHRLELHQAALDDTLAQIDKLGRDEAALVAALGAPRASDVAPDVHAKAQQAGDIKLTATRAQRADLQRQHRAILKDHGDAGMVVHLRALYKCEMPDFAAFIPYDCQCAPDPKGCECANVRVRDSYVVDGVLTARPVAVAVVDGVEVAPTTATAPLIAKPLTSLALSLRCPGVPDGTVVDTIAGVVRLTRPETPLADGVPAVRSDRMVFSGGQTNVITLTVPPHGSTGAIGMRHARAFVQVNLFVMGWGV